MINGVKAEEMKRPEQAKSFEIEGKQGTFFFQFHFFVLLTFHQIGDQQNMVKKAYSGELVTGIADEHASLPNSSISHCNTLYEL